MSQYYVENKLYPEQKSTKVYWKEGSILKSGTVDTGDHEEAILVTKEALVQSGVGYEGAVLAVIK